MISSASTIRCRQTERKLPTGHSKFMIRSRAFNRDGLPTELWRDSCRKTGDGLSL